MATTTDNQEAYQLQVSRDLENWSETALGEAFRGNDSIRSFMVDLALETALFARIAIWR